MRLTRRAFVRSVGLAGAVGWPGAVLQARGMEAWLAKGSRHPASDETDSPIRLDSNENPVGPSPATLDAVRASLTGLGRYPFGVAAALPDVIAAQLGVAPENVMITCGSTEVLRLAVQTYTSPSRALVTAVPTFEGPAEFARELGHGVRAVPLDASRRLDLRAMHDPTIDAGLVFLCNPNNPTGTLYGAADVADFIGRAIARSASTHVLVDEAYHDYVWEPSYRTAIPLALEHAQVIVSRTFSKAYGLAGLRVGYAVSRPETLGEMASRRLPIGVNLAAAHAATAAIADRDAIAREHQRNREAMALTRRALEDAGYPVPESNANFIFFDLRRPILDFQRACRAEGVAIGRPFPPFATWARVSIGTLDEMRRAVEVFRRALAAPAPSAAQIA